MIGVIAGVCSLVISGLSFWNAYQARKLSEEASLPELSETTELLQPLAVEQPINFKVTITNFGHTTAKQMEPVLKYAFSKAGVPFDPKFPSDVASTDHPTSSELAAGDHTVLFSKNTVYLAHDHDVAAVLSGAFNLYLYGRIPYKDVLGNSHEFHFCRLITAPVPGAEPLKPQKCTGFNYSY
jgi:hypothetical protein